MRYHKDGTLPTSKWAVWVFGSNTLGIHAGGAAYVAQTQYGAINGVGEGMTGQSYAIPTMASPGGSKLHLDHIRKAVQAFIVEVRKHPKRQYFVTAIGCGIAGFQHLEIAPMFKDCPSNCSLPRIWKSIIEQKELGPDGYDDDEMEVW